MAPAAFLTSQWLDELRLRLQAVVIGSAQSPRLALGQIVTGAPAGTTSYTISFGAGQPVTVEPGADQAQVTLIEDYQTALRLAEGVPAGELLSLGKVKLRGDVNALLSAAEQLSELADALAGA